MNITPPKNESTPAPEIDFSGADSFSKDIRDLLREFDFVIVRQIGKDSSHIRECLVQSGLQVFVDEFNRSDIQLRVSPHEKTNAERSKAGNFHTDFSMHPVPPSVLLLQCVLTDPRHPFYGRNQVVQVSKILRRIKELDDKLFQLVANASFPVKIRGRNLLCPFLSRIRNHTAPICRFHPGYIDNLSLKPQHYYNAIPISDWIEYIAMENCWDFALNAGDCFIASNFHCLHRRDTSTIRFETNLSSWHARTINTVRFTNNL